MIECFQNPEININEISFVYHDLYAKKVELKSSFDHWEQKYKFKRIYTKKNKIRWNGLWELKLPLSNPKFQLKKGKYFYRMLIDDIFTHDRGNKNTLSQYNIGDISYFIVKEDLFDVYNIKSYPIRDSEKGFYKFIYKGNKFDKVFIVGNFNDWNEYKDSLKHIGDGIWTIKLKLIPGKYYYNFVINEKWRRDSLISLLDPRYPNFSFFEISH